MEGNLAGTEPAGDALNWLNLAKRALRDAD